MVKELKEQTLKELKRNRHIVAMCLLSSGSEKATKELDLYNEEINKRLNTDNQ